MRGQQRVPAIGCAAACNQRRSGERRPAQYQRSAQRRLRVHDRIERDRRDHHKAEDEAAKEEVVVDRKRNFELLSDAQPEDLIKFGLIPEFVGRLPVLGVLEDLDEFALIEILTRPKNAIIKQYQRLFEFENVRLKFSDDALKAISRQAMARKVGARGLRMILEELMLDLMYHLPSQKKVKEFEVTREMVEKRNVSLATMDKAG